MTYNEVKETYPEIYAQRAEDKLRFRYYKGESYLGKNEILDSSQVFFNTM